MAITYEFDNLEIDIPKSSGPWRSGKTKCQVEDRRKVYKFYRGAGQTSGIEIATLVS